MTKFEGLEYCKMQTGIGREGIEKPIELALRVALNVLCQPEIWTTSSLPARGGIIPFCRSGIATYTISSVRTAQCNYP